MMHFLTDATYSPENTVIAEAAKRPNKTLLEEAREDREKLGKIKDKS